MIDKRVVFTHWQYGNGRQEVSGIVVDKIRVLVTEKIAGGPQIHGSIDIYLIFPDKVWKHGKERKIIDVDPKSVKRIINDEL